MEDQRDPTNAPIKAKHAGMCYVCARPIYTGDTIVVKDYPGFEGETQIAAHEECESKEVKKWA